MKNLKSILVLAFIIISSTFSFSQTAPVDKNNLAIGGYDVVSYFTANQAEKGNEKYTATHQGVTYYFSSSKNKALFTKDASKYLPQCDGYCAWGVAEKTAKFPINPETFKIVDGKLYLFFNGDFNGQLFNTLTEWNKDEKRLLELLAPNWEKAKKL